MNELYEQLMHRQTRPTVIVGRDNQVLRINPAAQRLITRTGALRVESGILMAVLPRVTEDLHRKIKKAIHQPAKGAEVAGILVMTLPRPNDLRPLVALVMSLQNERTPRKRAATAGAALWLDDPSENIKPSAEALRTWFGLTPAECRAAIDLTNGLSPKEIAAKHGRHVRTVRTQIEAVFRKLGVSRTAHLVRVITRVATLATGTLTALALEILNFQRLDALEELACAML